MKIFKEQLEKEQYGWYGSPQSRRVLLLEKCPLYFMEVTSRVETGIVPNAAKTNGIVSIPQQGIGPLNNFSN